MSMDHVAILRKSKISKGDDLLGDILKGIKTIESRWYVNKIDPWNKINKGDEVYFKESGCPITAKARVFKVLQFENLNRENIINILNEYGKAISPTSSNEQLEQWADKILNKRYCILVFLGNVEKIEPIYINKKGFGISCAWMCGNNNRQLVFFCN